MRAYRSRRSNLHVELESHDVLLAEGAPSESFVDDDSRQMFGNPADYYVRYPGPANGSQAVFYAPRIDDGVGRVKGGASSVGQSGLELDT